MGFKPIAIMEIKAICFTINYKLTLYHRCFHIFILKPTENGKV